MAVKIPILTFSCLYYSRKLFQLYKLLQIVLARFRWFQLDLDVLDHFRSFQIVLCRFISVLTLVSTYNKFIKKEFTRFYKFSSVLVSNFCNNFENYCCIVSVYVTFEILELSFKTCSTLNLVIEQLLAGKSLRLRKIFKCTRTYVLHVKSVTLSFDY